VKMEDGSSSEMSDYSAYIPEDSNLCSPNPLNMTSAKKKKKKKKAGLCILIYNFVYINL
jgi:hypothetical protein